MIDLTGLNFGEWTVLERDNDKKYSSPYWKCKCSCGNIKSIRGSALKAGLSKSCGCKKNRKDIKGQKFDHLIALEPTEQKSYGSIVWKCQCDCGNITYKSVQKLNEKKNLSCGCVSSCLKKESLIGQQFGKLTVISLDKEKTNNDIYNRSFWICKCECGSIKSISGNNLRTYQTLSCGCLSSQGEEKIAKILVDNNILFEKEKTFEDGKYNGSNRNFRFDFYLPEKNIIIEYDGKQHFMKASTWEKHLSLEERQQRDKIKNEWCHNHGITIIRIPYTHLDNIVLEDLIENSKYVI